MPIRRRLLAAAVVLAAALPAHALAASLRGPNFEGDLSVSGLTAPVRVLRDEHGIPYIFAQNTPDLIRAQGFVTAQDRLFQMEGYRAIATGRLPRAWARPGWPATARSGCWACAATPSATRSCSRRRRATSCCGTHKA